MGKRKSKRGRSARNARKGDINGEPEELVKAPHCFVIPRGHLGKNGTRLMLNFRKIMEPYTASQLKVKKQNCLKDFIHIAGLLNVTHLMVFTKSEIAMYLRVIKLPRGPTLTFRIHEYCLAKDVVSSLKKALIYEKLFSHHPLLVLNNFSGEGLHFKLMTTMFQGMLPSININKANLNTIRRCLLMSYNSDKSIDLRHYAIKVVPCGMSKAVRKLIQNKVPNLANYQDVSEFIQSGNLSESEAEMDGAVNQVVLPQPISSRGNMVSQKSAIRLYELGPRMKLQLIKIEEGVVSGEVLFHQYIKKTPEEIEALKASRERKMQLKAYRRAIQEQNVKKKLEKENKATGKNEDCELVPEDAGVKEERDKGQGSRKRKLSLKSQPGKKVRFSEGASENAKENSDALKTFLARRKKKKLAKLKKKTKPVSFKSKRTKKIKK